MKVFFIGGCDDGAFAASALGASVAKSERRAPVFPRVTWVLQGTMAHSASLNYVDTLIVEKAQRKSIHRRQRSLRGGGEKLLYWPFSIIVKTIRVVEAAEQVPPVQHTLYT